MQRHSRRENATTITTAEGVTVELTLAPASSRKVKVAEPPPKREPATCKGRVPRFARLMALAIKLQDMIDRGEIRDYAELARLGYVSRARITQIMNLLNLAPNIQEQILFLPPGVRTRPDYGRASPPAQFHHRMEGTTAEVG